MQGLRILILIFVIIAYTIPSLNAQCPQVNIEITNVMGIGCETNPLQSGEMCPLDFYTITLEQDLLLPPNSEIDWYKDTDSNIDFDDDHYIGTSQINTNPSTVSECSPCPEILAILVDACQGGNFGNEPENEFVVLSSGGGFNVDDLSFDFFSTNNFHPDPLLLPFHGDINTMNSICELMVPQASLITSVSNSVQCTQVFGAGPGDFIPAGAIVLLFTNCNVTIDYDFNEMCANGAPVYVLQNGCCRQRGAFTNPDGDPGFRTQILSFDGPNCDCTSELTYQTNDPVLSSIPNGGGAGIIYYGLDGDLISVFDPNCVAPPVSLIPLPPLTSTLDPFAGIVSFDDCGETIFIQGLLSPTFEGCDETTTDVFTFEVNCEEPMLLDHELCVGGTVDLDILNPNGINGGWITTNGLPVSDFTPTQTGTETFVFFPSECCVDSAAVTINVTEGEAVDIIPDTAVCVTFGEINLDGLINTDPIPTGTWSTGSNTFDPAGNSPDDIITISFTPDDECGIAVMTDIIITASPDSLFSTEICANESIEINGELFHINNPSMTFTIPASEGCDTLLTVDVTFFDLPESDFIDTICFNESIMVGDSLFDNQTSTGLVTFSSDPNSNDCDSLVNVSIHVLPEVVEGPDDLQSLCAGNNETYETDGTVFDEDNPTGFVTIQNADGCDSTFMVIVDFIEAVTGPDFSDQFCSDSGDGVMLGGIQFDEDNPIGVATLTSNVTGCDSLINVSLIYNDGVQGDDVNEQTCDENFSLDFGNGQIFDMATPSGQVVLTSAQGCDSTFMVNINFSGDVQGSDVNEQTCDSNFSLDYGNGQVFDMNTPSGQVVLTSSEGCDSTFMVNIDFAADVMGTDVSEQTCDSNFSLDFGNGQVFDMNTPSGQVVLTSSEGCDSTFMVNIDFSGDVQGVDVNQQTCDDNFSLDFGNGQVFDMSMPSGQVVLTSSEGCDSTFMVNIDFSGDVQGADVNQQTCDDNFSLDFGNGQVFDMSTPSGQVVLTSSEGCDSTFMVNIDFSGDVQGVDVNQQTCDDNFTLDFGNGQVFDMNTPSGQVVLTSSEGCDSTFMVNIDFAADVMGTDVNEQTCDDNFSLDFGNGQVFDLSTPFGQVVLTSSEGCDSTFMVNINFSADVQGMDVNQQTCDSNFSLDFGNGQIFDMSTPSGQVILTSSEGCDSTFMVNIDFSGDVQGVDVNQQTCDDNFSLDFGNGQVFDMSTPSGQVVLTSSEGCDSTFMVNIDFSGDVQGVDVNQQTCDDNFSLDFGNGQVFDMSTPSGQVVLTSSEGCDSTFMVNIDFSADVQGVDVNQQTCDDNFSLDFGNGQIFDMNTPSGQVVLTSSEGCDSTFMVNIDFSGDVQGVNVFEQTCDDNFSLDFGNGQVFDMNTPSGQVVLTSSEGCDSTFIVNIDFSADVQGMDVMEQTCDDNFSLDFGNGQVFDISTPSGQVVLTSSEGCDSTFMVNIDFSADVQGVDVNQQTCDDNFSLDFGNGQVFDMSTPSGQVVLTSSEGCDSTFMVNIDFSGDVQGVNVNQQTCDDNFSLDFGNGQVFDMSTPSGQVVLTSSAGCDSTFMVNIDFGTESSSLIEETHCIGDNFELDINGTLFNEANPAGSVIFPNANSEGCDSTVFVDLTYTLVPISLSASPNRICSGEEITITINFASSEFIVVEIAKSDGTVQAFNNVEDGFTFTDFVDANTTYTINQATGVDCLDLQGLSEVSIEVSELSVELMASDYNGFEVSCEDASDGFIDIIFENPGLGNLSYIWSNGSTESSLSNLPAGNYSLTVIDETGCESIAEIVLEDPESLTVDYDVQNPGCLGLGSGSITINDIQGGAGEFGLSINDEPMPLGTIQTPVTFNNLNPGSYILNFVDANSCSFSEEVVIELGQDLDLVLEETVEINLGEDYQISLQANFDIDSISWSAVDGLSCYNCVDPIASPENTAVYEVQAWSADGCNTTALITFLVRKDFDYYIPTAFSPNEDGFNDGFTIYAGEDVVNIQTLAIFDRWGSQVFLGTNMTPNNVQEGWDGEKKGNQYPPGVYVYYAEIELSSGEIILEEGDVTLMR